LSAPYFLYFVLNFFLHLLRSKCGLWLVHPKQQKTRPQGKIYVCILTDDLPPHCHDEAAMRKRKRFTRSFSIRRRE
jgi:hypothetical protein